MNAPLRRLSVVVAVLFLALFAQRDLHPGRQRRRAQQPTPATPGPSTSEYSRERGPIVARQDRARASRRPTNDLYKYLRQLPAGQLYAPVTGYYCCGLRPATGIEPAENDVLAGTADQLFFRRISDLLTGREPRAASVELTIDPAVQQAACGRPRQPAGRGRRPRPVDRRDPRHGQQARRTTRTTLGHAHARAAQNGPTSGCSPTRTSRCSTGPSPGDLPAGLDLQARRPRRRRSPPASYTPDTLVPAPAVLDAAADDGRAAQRRPAAVRARATR